LLAFANSTAAEMVDERRSVRLATAEPVEETEVCEALPHKEPKKTGST
jgi:hypothetical protein